MTWPLKPMALQTDPYPWPFDHDRRSDLAAERMAVVVCGWQPHWRSTIAAPDGAADLDDRMAEIATRIGDLRALGAVVMWVRNGSSPSLVDRPAALPLVGSDSWQLLDGPRSGDVVVDTPGLDAFLVGWTDRELRARGRDRLVICGLGTEGPISSTTRSANDRGYECLTATDAVVHHAPETGAAHLSSVCMSGGIFGAVGAAADLIEELRREPGFAGRVPPTPTPHHIEEQS